MKILILLSILSVIFLLFYAICLVIELLSMGVRHIGLFPDRKRKTLFDDIISSIKETPDQWGVNVRYTDGNFTNITRDLQSSGDIGIVFSTNKLINKSEDIYVNMTFIERIKMKMAYKAISAYHKNKHEIDSVNSLLIELTGFKDL